MKCSKPGDILLDSVKSYMA